MENILSEETIVSEETVNEGNLVENPGEEECSRKLLTEEENKPEEEEKLGGPQFMPRLYLQRYYFVQQMLIKYNAEKIVDFGSAECKISRFLANIPTARDIALVDIDRTLLEMSKWCIRPMTCDFICRREKPLRIKVFEGDVTQCESRLEDCDAITMVEVIEHLLPEVLNAAVSMVFGQLMPRIVVMTTPNAEFNVLFPGFDGFRHWDHKFEWTRTEFQSWCADIAERYDYRVEYSGIGEPPEDNRHLGSCSQAAVFHRNYDRNVSDDQIISSECYSLIAECSYPYKTADERLEDPLLSEIEFQLRQFQTDTQYEDYDCNCLVPVSTLLRFKKIKSEFTEDKLRDYLRSHGYRLSEDGGVIILPAVHKSYGSDTDSVNDNAVDESEIQTDKLDEKGKLTDDEIDFWD